MTASCPLDAFARLHTGSTPLLLPNAWDAASAALLQESEAQAMAELSMVDLLGSVAAQARS
jgi:2-methylisocitrate lyase-like PEP mutase family enzyme